MQYSDNGWPGIPDRTDLKKITVPGTDLNFACAPGAAWILAEFAGRFHKDIESLTGGQLDDWSYAWRDVRGGSSLSCHASGTALDLNALAHFRGVKGTFGTAKLEKLRSLLSQFKDPETGVSVIKWGGDFKSPPSIVDEMHFQIRGDLAGLKRVRAKLTELMKENDMALTAKNVWEADVIPVTKTVTAEENPTWKAENAVGETFDNTIVLVRVAKAIPEILEGVGRIEAAVAALALALENVTKGS